MKGEKKVKERKVAEYNIFSIVFTPAVPCLYGVRSSSDITYLFRKPSYIGYSK